jgi:uncharacterized protein (UPF0261 family)
MPTVALLGTLDSKGEECEFLKTLLTGQGCSVILIDVGILGAPLGVPDVSREEVARGVNVDLSELVAAGDRGRAIEMMGIGAIKVVRDLYADGQIDGALALGGSGGSSIAAAAMRALPIGTPKMLVSTIAAGDVSSYVGETDLTMMYSVVDFAGLNTFSKRILTNAAAAIAGMVQDRVKACPECGDGAVIAISMFGVTTHGVTIAQQWLRERGYQVLVFHANGAGGRAMERLIKDGYVDGVLDMTTTELADEVGGGRLSAGANRLEVAGELGIPQVVSLGALDVINFGPLDDVPPRYRGRRLYKHNPNVTLMRTSVEESRQVGAMIGRKLNRARGPVCVFVPLGGLSSISRKGAPFHDEAADAALLCALRDTLSPSIETVLSKADINDPEFALAAATKLHQLIVQQRGHASCTGKRS